MAKAIKPTIRFAADFDAYKRELKRAIGQTDKFDRTLKGAGKRNNFRGIGKAALGAAAGIGAVTIAANELKKSVQATSNLAKATRQLQRATGLTAEEASQLAAVLQVRGIGTDKLGRSFVTLARQIESAQTGAGGAADAFRQLGVSQDAIRAGDVSSILVQSADGFEKLGDGTDKAAIAQQLFGRSSRDLIPLLEGGGKALRDQLGLAPKLSQEQVQQALAATVAQRNFNLALLNLRVTIGLAVLPYLSKAATALSNFITQVQQGVGFGGALRDRFLALSDSINKLVSPLTKTDNRLVNIGVALTGIAATLAGAKLIAGLTGFGGALIGIFSNPYLAAAVGIAGLIAGIGAAAFVAYKKSKPFKELIDDIGRTLKPVFRSIGETAKKELPKVGREFGRMTKELGGLLKELRPVLLPIIRLLGKTFETTIRGIAPALRIAATAIRGATTAMRGMSAAMKVVIKIASDFKGAIKTAFGQALGPINSVISAIRTLLREAKKLPGVSALGGILGAIAPRSLEPGARGASARGAMARMAGPVARASAAPGVLSPGSPTMSARDNILSASSFALAERYAQLLEFQTDLESQIVKLEDRKDDAARDALRARRRALADTAKEIGLNERIRAQLEARSQLEQSIVEARLRALNAAIDARDLERQSLRNANAAEDFAAERVRLTSEIDNPNADFAASRDELTRLISQAQADAANPAAQARFARDRARLEAQIARATARGDLDARDAAEQQLAALEERYGADRVSRLQAQLQALNDEEAARVNRAREDRDRLDIEEQQRLDDITRAANEASAATAGFIGDLKELIDSLMTGAVSFGSFVAQLSALGIGIPADSGFAGVIGANQIIPTDGIPEMTVRGKIQDYLRNRDKGTYNASAIGRATGLSRATVWKNRSAAPSGYKIKNRVSGGYLNPGALTLVGETGPELIVSPGGGQVISGSRTQRMGSAGGVTLNVYPRTSANDPTELARALGWQLATR